MLLPGLKRISYSDAGLVVVLRRGVGGGSSRGLPEVLEREGAVMPGLSGGLDRTGLISAVDSYRADTG